jgi:hypothetical protein
MASARALIGVLGEPHRGESVDGKVTMEWSFQTPVGIATLYDFKWRAAEIPDRVEQWSIGGSDDRVVAYVKKYVQGLQERADRPLSEKKSVRFTVEIVIDYDASSIQNQDKMQLYSNLKYEIERAIGNGMLSPSGEEIVNKFEFVMGG